MARSTEAYATHCKRRCTDPALPALPAQVVEKIVTKEVEVPVERIVTVEKEVPVERTVERIVEVERIVHVPVQTPPAGGPLQATGSYGGNSLNASPRAPGPPATATAAHTANAAAMTVTQGAGPVPVRAPEAQAQGHHRAPQASLGAAAPRSSMPVPAPLGHAPLPVPLASAPAGGPSPAALPVTRSLNIASDRDLAPPPSGSQAGSSFPSQVAHAASHWQAQAAGEAGPGWGSEAAAARASGRAWTPTLSPNEHGYA